MKVLACILLSYLACICTIGAQPSSIQVRHLRDYHYVGSNQTLELKEGINCFVLTNRKQYEKFFGTTNRADTPNFTNEVMLLLLMPSSNKDAKLGFQKVDMKAGNFVEVYCDVKTNLGKMTYMAYPTVACAIPRYANVQKMKFYDAKNMRLIATVPVKQ